MAKRIIVWTETAARQRRAVLKYWTFRNKSTVYAKKLIKLIAKRAEIIAKNPMLFKPADFPETRVCAIGHFSIFYKYTNNKLIITAFWDNRQDPAKLFDIIGD